jgi:hypothetical protein
MKMIAPKLKCNPMRRLLPPITNQMSLAILMKKILPKKKYRPIRR